MTGAGGVERMDTETNEGALRTQCKKCGKQGHWARMCQTMSVREIRTEEGSNSEEESVYLGTVSRKNGPKAWDVPLKMQRTS